MLEKTITLDVDMPASGSVTQGQLERDLIRVRKQIEDLRRSETALRGALKFYFPDSPMVTDVASSPITEETDWNDITIADGCKLIFQEVGKEWLTLADLDGELRAHGRVCNKGSVEIALKDKPEWFEWQRRGKKNVYRLKPAPKLVSVKSGDKAE